MIFCKTNWNGNHAWIKRKLLSSTKWHSRKGKPNSHGDGKNYDSRKSKQSTTLDLERGYGVTTYILNRIPPNKTKLSPFEIWAGHKPDVISKNFWLKSFCSHPGCQTNETGTKMYRRHPSGFLRIHQSLPYLHTNTSKSSNQPWRNHWWDQGIQRRHSQSQYWTSTWISTWPLCGTGNNFTLFQTLKINKY